MGAVTFTARAYSDILRLRAFVERESPRAAEVAVARIFEGIDLLALFPRAGVSVRREIRRLIIRRRRIAYIVRYRVIGEDVEILRIWHSKERRR